MTKIIDDRLVLREDIDEIMIAETTTVGIEIESEIAIERDQDLETSPETGQEIDLVLEIEMTNINEGEHFFLN